MAAADDELLTLCRGDPFEAVELLERLKGTPVELNIQIGFQNEKGETPLYVASQNGHRQVVEMLLEAGAATDVATRDRWTPLHVASNNAHHQVVGLLVAAGADKDATQNTGATPLHIASRKGHHQVMEVLLAEGANKDAAQTNGATPLHIASQNGNHRMVVMLLAAGADKDAALMTSETSLHIASENGHHQVVETLLAAGADKDAATNDGMTALHFSAENGHQEVVRHLLSVGADRWKRFRGESPLEIARNRYHSGLVSLLSNPTRPPLSPLIAASLTTLNRVKLMVVGRAAVGKTTLVRTLFGKQLDASIPSTDGIDLGLFRAGGIEFMTWDFGGQKVYRYTHQLFLSSHAVYLVLFKVSDPVSESLKEVRFWLNSISARIPNSVVLLVGTHADKTDARVAQRRATELSQTIVRENPSLLHAGQQVHLISAYAAAQPAFKGLLEAIIVAGKSMNFPAPKYFASALLSLNGLSLSPPVIELRHAVTCLQEVGNSEFQILKLLDAFHIMGLILVFRNEELHSRGVIVLRPQWIARLMATIVTTRHNFVSRDSGVLLHSVLVNQLWTGHDDFPPERHRNLVDLLVQLDIFFPVGHTEEDKGYFVPCMLREEALDVGFYLPCQLSDAALQLHRVMELECAVPISVIPPIMVELMGCGELRARWQQGCVVQIPASQPGVDDTVWLQVWRSGGRKIELKMWGESTQTVTQWLQRVCSRIDGRLKEFYHVGYRTLIPCRGCLSNDSSSDGHFDLLQLRDEVLQSHTEASCQPDERHNFRLDVMVPDLLFLDLSSPGFVVPFESLEEICELGQGAFGKVLKMTAPVHKVDGRVRNSQRPSTSAFPSGSSRPMADDQSAPSTPSSTSPAPTAEPTVVAVKFIGEVKRTKQRSVGNFFQEFKHEVYLMSSLEDPNLVKLIGICLQPKLAMVMEVVEGGDLCGQLHDPFRLKSPVFGLAESISAAFSNFNMNMTFRYVFLNRHKLTGPDREQLEGRIVGLMAKPRADAIGWIQEQFDQNSRASDFIRLTNANPVTDLRVTARQLEQLGVPRPPVLETLGDGALEKARQAFREWKASVNVCGASGLVGHIESWEHRFFEGAEELAGMWSADASFNDFKRMGQKMKEIEDGIERLSREQSVMVAPVDEALRLKLAIDIARGMVCLHELNPPIVHRDLKTPNVFLTRPLVNFPSLESGDESWDTPLAKVGDFGLSLLGLQSQFFQIRNREEDDPLLNFNATWAAPELLSGRKYSTPVDVYSMGIVLWELLLRQYPFQGISIPRIASEVIAGRRPAVPVAMAKDPNLREYTALMMRCWHQKPARRPSMREVYDSLRNICQARCPILAAKLMPPPAPREVVSRRDHDSHEQETAPVVTLHTFAAPVSSRAQTPQVACMLAPLKQQEVLWLGLESGHLAMVDCQLGEPQRQVLHWIQCCDCDRHQQRVTAISHLCRHSDDEGTIWTGSEDGSIHVWSPQLQSLEEIYDANTLKGRLKYRSRRLFIERAIDCWMECEHGALTWFEKRHDRSPTRVLPLKSIRSVFMTDSHTLSLVDSSGKTHEFLQPEDDQGYCGVTEWHRVLNNIMSLRASSPRGITRLAGQRQSQQAILALEGMDHTMWSANAGFLLTEWGLDNTVDHHGLHRMMQLRPLRNVQLDGSRLPARMYSIGGFVRVAATLLWVAVGDRWVVLDATSGASTWTAAVVEGMEKIVAVLPVMSEAGQEVWTIDYEGRRIVWRCGHADNPEVARELVDEGWGAEDGRGYCMTQVGGRQVWMGTSQGRSTSQGRVLAWDISGRHLIRHELQPLPGSHLLAHDCSVHALVSILGARPPIVWSASRDQTLRRFSW